MKQTKHKKQSAKADGGDATLVRPSDWNADHAAGEFLTNRTGDTLDPGDVVALDPGFDDSVTMDDTQDSLRQFVVAKDTILADATGLFEQIGGAQVRVGGAVVRGNYLAKSGATKALYDTGISSASQLAPFGAIAIAQTGSGGPGVISAILFGTTLQAAVTRKGLDIPSSSVITVPVGITFAHVTGTAAISGITARSAGTPIVLTFDGSLQLTHNGTTMFLANARNYQTQPGDTLWFVAEGGGAWRQICPVTAQVAQVIASSYVSVGNITAQSGVVRLPSTGMITSRNAANTADVRMLNIDPSDQTTLGPGGSANIRIFGQLRFDIDAASRAVAPVGTNKWAV